MPSKDQVSDELRLQIADQIRYAATGIRMPQLEAIGTAAAERKIKKDGKI